MSYGKAKSYGPNGCGKCGETKTLNILNEFKSLYEKRMEQLEEEARAGGDCLQAKLHLQEQWIKDLMEQNEMMARAVEQLEVEATERVQMLEEKLQSSARCICEKEEEIQEQGRKISDLTKKTDKVDKFGEPEELLGLLKKKEEDFNELKQAYEEVKTANEKLRKQLDQSKNELNKVEKEIDKVKHELKTSLENTRALLHSTLQSLNVSDISLDLLSQISSIRNSIDSDHTCLNMSPKQLDSAIENSKKFNISLSLVNKLISAQESLDKDSILIDLMEKEIKQLKEHVTVKDKQLLEQMDVIIALVSKLYELNKDLSNLEANVVDYFSGRSRTDHSHSPDFCSGESPVSCRRDNRFESKKNSHTHNNTKDDKKQELECDVVLNFKRKCCYK